MSLSNYLLFLVAGFYVAAFVFYIVEFSNTDRKSFSWGSRLIEVGFLIHTLQIFVVTFTASGMVGTRFYLPVGTMGENANFFAWSLSFVYFSFVKRNKTEGFSLILAPILVLFIIPALIPEQEKELRISYANDSYFLMHILSAFFGYASFTLSFIAGLLYLVQDRVLKRKSQIRFYHKLVPLQDLERFVFRTIFWGLVLLSAAILTGALWTKRAFGSFLLFDPKTFSALAMWGVYVYIMFLHEVAALKGRRVILVSVLSFALVLFTFLGTSVLKTGIHV
jgi:ABC-type transport system involved in cytochrome c biogenesis permease subunit